MICLHRRRLRDDDVEEDEGGPLILQVALLHRQQLLQPQQPPEAANDGQVAFQSVALQSQTVGCVVLLLLSQCNRAGAIPKWRSKTYFAPAVVHV